QNAAGATNDVTPRAFTVFCESLPVQAQSRGRKTAAGVMIQCTTRPLTDAGCNLLTIPRAYARSGAVALAMWWRSEKRAFRGNKSSQSPSLKFEGDVPA